MTGYGQQKPGTAAVPAQRTIPANGFLGSLTDDQQRSLLSLGTNHRYRPGQVIMREGGPADTVMVILLGMAKVIAVSESGKEILLGLRGRGDLLGEMAVMGGRDRSASVIAGNDLEASVIRAASFVSCLERQPQLASRVTDIVADKLRAANRRRLEYNSYPAESRVALVLYEVALAHGHREGPTWRIGAEITQADLASLASTSVRTIEKVLRVLEHHGVVVRRRRDLIVTDLTGLKLRGKF